ncbi:MAG: sigma-70 family RNA polymerase sigma factor [Thermodesulfobacteriales bacterium]|nr:MAG: sigma-70 family RNA polymerase sigma factor [Thermodesulfobacteriales bacterium]
MDAIALREPLNIFLKEIEKYPVLTKEEEYKLALSYYEEKDLEAANTLVVSNLRFVVKLAREFFSYGFPLSDLVQEGTIGLMKAVKKFDPFKGYRLISYAVWWIRAGIQNHIMKFWSQVKIGTTQAQRKLFHKIGKAKKELNIKNNKMTEQEVSKVAELFGVKNKDVIDMEFRMASRDYSLDATSTEDNTVSYLDILSDGKANQEKVIESIEANDLAHQGITDGLKKLSPREQKVIESRYLKNPPEKLRELGEELGISKERVRQIEVHALKKLKGAVETVISNGT